MKNIFCAFFIAACLLSFPLHAQDAKAADSTKATPKDETTFPALSFGVLSPDGKHIAGFAAGGFPGEFQRLMAQLNVALGATLYMVDTQTLEFEVLPGGAKWVTEGFWRHVSSVRNVRWVTNDLLVIEYAENAQVINTRGEYIMHLGDTVIGKADPDNANSPYLLTLKGSQIQNVNVVTGETTRLRYPVSGKPIAWAVDAQGTVRALSLLNSDYWKDATLITNWYWRKEKSEWEKLAEFKITDRIWTPQSVLEDGKSLAVSSNIGRDTLAVFAYDVDKHAIGEMLAGHPTEDIRMIAGLKQNKFLSVTTEGMKPKTTWFDRHWAIAQRTADDALPNRINVLSGDPEKRLLVLSYSDVDAGTWYLLDMQAHSMKRFAMVYPGVEHQKMQPMEITSWTAADGLTIPAYLTRPAGVRKPAPMIVMIHGGPAARDYWGVNSEVQMLVKEGYVVLQPQFRGSTGFGAKFMEAGFGQWGLAMQDDITAGVEAMIKRDIADPARICIYGASYGGYAALWGLVKTPGLYRCGVSFAGVADIEKILTDRSEITENQISREIVRNHIGDVKLSKAQFDEVSPLKHADRIQAPVLLMHGDKDRRVPISHSRQMMKALDAAKKTYEWQELADEGHSVAGSQNTQLYNKRLLAFFNKYIPVDKAGPVEQAKAGSADVVSPKPAN